MADIPEVLPIAGSGDDYVPVVPPSAGGGGDDTGTAVATTDTWRGLVNNAHLGFPHIVCLE